MIPETEALISIGAYSDPANLDAIRDKLPGEVRTHVGDPDKSPWKTEPVGYSEILCQNAGKMNVTITQYKVGDNEFEVEISIKGIVYPRFPLQLIRASGTRQTDYIGPRACDLPQAVLKLCLKLRIYEPEPQNRNKAHRMESIVRLQRIVAGLGKWMNLRNLDVHHTTYNGLENRINYLQVLTPEEHRRVHRRDGVYRLQPIHWYGPEAVCTPEEIDLRRQKVHADLFGAAIDMAPGLGDLKELCLNLVESGVITSDLGWHDPGLDSTSGGEWPMRILCHSEVAAARYVTDRKGDNWRADLDAALSRHRGVFKVMRRSDPLPWSGVEHTLPRLLHRDSDCPCQLQPLRFGCRFGLPVRVGVPLHVRQAAVSTWGRGGIENRDAVES